MKRLTAELNMAESAQQAQDMDIQRLANELQVQTHAKPAQPETHSNQLLTIYLGNKTKISPSKET